MINLFILKSCPYCKKVMNFIEENNFEANFLDINNENNLEELLKLGGKRQVPFLFDNTNHIEMYESNDIIEYLRTLKNI